MSFQTPVPRLGEAPTNVSRSSLGALERTKCQITAPVCTEIAPGDADRAHVRDAVFDITARSAAAEDAEPAEPDIAQAEEAAVETPPQPERP
jgi:hypothetical protein